MRLAGLARALSSRTPRHLPDVERRSSVAVVLREGRGGGSGDFDVLYLRRRDLPSDPWSGQVAFPGCKRDPGDADDLATAVREAFETATGDADARVVNVQRVDEWREESTGRLS